MSTSYPPLPAGVVAQLTDAQRVDPDVVEFAYRATRATHEEKQSDPDDWSPEESDAWAREDWRTFSVLRGYTEGEIENFAHFIRLAGELDEKYGADFACWLDFAVAEDPEDPRQ